MPRIEQSVLIDAPLDVTYRIARDVEDFPTFMDDLQSLTLQEKSEDGLRTVTEWVGIVREFKLTVKWVQEDRWNDETHRDEFVQLRGDMDRMSGYWQFAAVGDGQTSWESVLDYEYNVPLIGPIVKNLIKKKLTDNLHATMLAIKTRAEQEVRAGA
jgi:ribosome-associated toxin RatA of RatAB toxin-antitoxin module